jgi:hypothetical protein
VAAVLDSDYRWRGWPLLARSPPSTGSTAPVTNLASGLARKAITSAASVGSAALGPGRTYYAVVRGTSGAAAGTSTTQSGCQAAVARAGRGRCRPHRPASPAAPHPAPGPTGGPRPRWTRPGPGHRSTRRSTSPARPADRALSTPLAASARRIGRPEADHHQERLVGPAVSRRHFCTELRRLRHRRESGLAGR